MRGTKEHQVSDAQTTPGGALERTTRTVATFGGDILEFFELVPDEIAESVFDVVDYPLAQRLQFVPVMVDEVEVIIALADPSNLIVLDDLRIRLAPRSVRVVASDPELITRSPRQVTTRGRWPSSSRASSSRQ